MHRMWQGICRFMLILSVWFLVGCTGRIQEELEMPEVTAETEETLDEKEQEVPAEEVSIFVHVCGHVCTPGVYELESHSRVYEAIEAAGGMTETAAFSYLNQAEELVDGQQVYVPGQEAEGQKTVTVGQTAEDDGKVNLNTATKEELMTLPGIGEVRAEMIIEYRQKKERFDSIDELKEIEGIKEGVFQKLKDQIKI